MVCLIFSELRESRAGWVWEGGGQSAVTTHDGLACGPPSAAAPARSLETAARCSTKVLTNEKQ